MRTSALLLAVAVASTLFGAIVVRAEDRTAEAPEYVVVPHLKGSLALQASHIRTVWYRPATPEQPSQLRVSSPALDEAKTLGGDGADALWKTLHQGAPSALFVFVSHMDGTLGIPRDQIRTAYYAEDAGKATLRLQYDGDPGGKTLAGDEATRIWKTIAPQQP